MKSSSITILFLLLSIDCYSDKFNSFIAIKADLENVDNKTEIAIKDNIDVVGFATTAGSLALKNNFPTEDAFIIKKLKKNNFIIYGKTNLSEWANFRSTKSISGWSSIGGQTFNTHGENNNPCGSSSGSAVAVSSGILNMSIGTETNGSISCPASVNGIVGMKPTVGLVSRSGIIPISYSQDTAGPMGKDVKSVAEVLEIISGRDEKDFLTHKIPISFNFNFTKNLNKNSLQGKRFGLLKSGYDDIEGKRLIDDLIKIIEKEGGIIIEIDDTRKYPGEYSYFLLLYEFKTGIENYLINSNSEYSKLKDIIDFNEKNKEKVMTYFDQDIFYESNKASKNPKKYIQSIKEISLINKQTYNLFNKFKLDAMIGLTRNPAWKIDYKNGDDGAMSKQRRWGNGHFAAIAGLPHITVPFTKIDGLPVGVSFIGSLWSDKEIIEMAYSFEQVIK